MARSYLLYDREWIRTSMLNQGIKVSGICDKCHRAAAGPIWHSIKTGRSICLKCFDIARAMDRMAGYEDEGHT